ncbi:MAG: cadmium-translocating P-type ATPase [Rubrivivax sp.]|nr:cadmium-translocating P-type ATPase [Rubrivivax sp.]MBK8528417.1 cadmium-translocating P-type ATPase [Rubrivivax sp.]
MTAAIAITEVVPPRALPTGPGAPLEVLDDPLEFDACTRWETAADGRQLAESRLQLSGLYCAACADTIEQALQAVVGVQAVSVVAATQRATVRWDPSRTRLSTLIRAVQAAGYDGVPDLAAPARELRRREYRAALWRLFVASFCAMQVMMFATPSYLAAPGELAPDMRQLLNWGAWVVTLPVIWFAAGPFFRGAWQQLRRRRIGMDVPVALALGVTFVASMGATFEPGGVFGHEVYFDSLTMFLSFLLAGRWLELLARHHAAEDLERALAKLPDTAQRRTAAGDWEQVSVRRLRPGDVVRVAVGQAFPADGPLLQGHTHVNEALLTGESEPLPRGPGGEVVAASINVGSPVLLRVDRVGADTRFEAIVAMMRSAMSQRPAGARLADRWAGPFLWAVLGLAVLAAAAWSVIDPSRALWVAVSVLIVTCPCAFSLAAPAALVAAAGGLARRGVVVKRLEAIEALAGVSHVFIDKTGTLTEDRLGLRDVRVMPGLARAAADCQARAASLAAWSQHPLSRALTAAGAGSMADDHWTDLQELPGQGLQARDAHGRCWRLGSWAWASEPAAALPPPFEARVWLSCDGRVEAGFRFDEVLRDGAEQAVADLRSLGLSITLLTGDDADRAAAVAQRLGIDDVLAAATPEDKLARVAAAQARGAAVAMVGDGINDAPVLARSDVSLAMGQGALVARSQADAVIVSNRPTDLVLARRVSTRTMRIVRQNLVWAALYNAACIPLALVGWLPPWAAGLGMACSSLLVIANALRAAR